MASNVSKSSNLLIAAAMLAGIIVLSGLGFWQVQRLHWKEALIETVQNRRELSSEPLISIERLYAKDPEAIEFRPLSLSGRFLHEFERHFYTTRNGQVGWHIYTPLEMSDGRILFVNRGFVPQPLKESDTRKRGQLEGQLALEGLARQALSEKPNRFIPDNDLAANIFYWKNLEQMSLILPEEQRSGLLPFFVDAAPMEVPGNWPEGGATRVTFSNNHLQYAITWFGLALALLGVGSYFLYARNSKRQLGEFSSHV